MANLCKCIIFCLVVCLFAQPALAHPDCESRGDVSGGDDLPDGWVSISDLVRIINFMLVKGGVSGSGWSVPADGLPCADVADIYGQGSEGDGNVGASDVIYLIAYIKLYFIDFGGIYGQALAPAPLSLPAYCDACIEWAIDNFPLENSSREGIANEEGSLAQPGGIVTIVWNEGEEDWDGGSASLTINVSCGTYKDDFATGLNPQHPWLLSTYDVAPDGLGGFDITNTCLNFADNPAGPVFRFSFEIPDVQGPAYDITIAPTQGSWRRVMYYDLPSVVIPVASNLPPTLTITSPNGEEIIEAETTHTIQWDSTGGIADVTIEYFTDNGTNWIPVSPANTGNAGTYNWQMPSIESDQCLVRISDTSDAEINDVSDNLFTIYQCQIDFTYGDINQDCCVNLLDFAILAQNWLVSGIPVN